jgi:prevent-host-death family protein
MPEQTMTATHLRRNLGTVLDSVFKGTTVHVTRSGRPLCTLLPPGKAAAKKSPTKTEEDR